MAQLCCRTWHYIHAQFGKQEDSSRLIRRPNNMTDRQTADMADRPSYILLSLISSVMTIWAAMVIPF